MTSTEPHTYRVGTLHYDRRGLFRLFFWLLWGDFAFVFFEGIFGSFVPLYSKQFHASNALIGLMMGSASGALNLLFGPAMSRWSDNYRSQWGRRIPFLAACTPIIVVTVIVMGFAPEVGGMLYHGFIHSLAPKVELNSVILGLLTTAVVAFHFANMFLVNGYTWLQRDVIPLELMARFLAWIRVVSISSGALFSWFVFPHIIDERQLVCVSIGAFYTVAFLMMCWKVKEGEYPPPERRNESVVAGYVRYVRQCFTVRIYAYYFVRCIIGGISACAGTFQIFFILNTLGVRMGFLGEYKALMSVASAVLLLPAGWICDRYSPFRIPVICGIISLPIAVAEYFLNMNEHTFVIFGLLGLPLGVVSGLAGSAAAMEIFPTEKFGQYSAAGNILIMGSMILGNYLVGVYLDFVQNNYRMLLVWNFFFASLSLVLTWLIYREWLGISGKGAYVAPLPPE